MTDQELQEFKKKIQDDIEWAEETLNEFHYNGCACTKHGALYTKLDNKLQQYKLIQESKIINHFDLYIENPKLFELPNINNKYKDELKEFINKEVVVYVDRPINSVHPKYNDIIYPLNYGYIKEIKASDSEYQNAYILSRFV